MQQWKHPDYCVISDTFVSDSFSVDSFLASPLGLKTSKLDLPHLTPLHGFNGAEMTYPLVNDGWEIPYMELFFWDDPQRGGFTMIHLCPLIVGSFTFTMFKNGEFP